MQKQDSDSNQTSLYRVRLLLKSISCNLGLGGEITEEVLNKALEMEPQHSKYFENLKETILKYINLL